ncbi:MAG TPA: methionyl-tRNA formyltransferase [Terriglobales bacterium]|nr:methionyl-tRNA formyltransferase [Terriglobales bacterium]
MNLIFCGTPNFAAPTLEALIAAGHRIALVVTQPDRPKGRGLELTPSPVKRAAVAHHLPIDQPEKIKNNTEFRSKLEQIAPDAIIVVGYGRLIPAWMLSLPRRGNINLHASLLPKYRGAAPIQWAIASGETVSGVTTMLLNEGLDTGDILLQQELSIAPDENAISYGERLSAIGAELMIRTLEGLESGSIAPLCQDDARSSLAPLLKKEDGIADFTLPAQAIVNRLRGFQPWPGCNTSFRGKKLAIIHARTTSVDQTKVNPGEIIANVSQLLVGCGGGLVELLEVQPEGKRKMSAADFLRGYRLQPGEVLGDVVR